MHVRSQPRQDDKQVYIRPIARIFRRGVTSVSDMYVCMHKHARVGGGRVGACSPRKF